MKRGGPMKRTAFGPRQSPLPPGTGGLRRVPLERKTGALKPGSKGLKRSQLVSKSPTVTPQENLARELVEARAQGRCEGCGRPGRCEWAHRVGRAQGGPWSAANGLWLCGDLTGGRAPTTGGGCHPWSHSSAGRAVCEARGWILRRIDDPLSVPVLHARFGLVLLDAAGSVTPYKREAA